MSTASRVRALALGAGSPGIEPGLSDLSTFITLGRLFHFTVLGLLISKVKIIKTPAVQDCCKD